MPPKAPSPVPLAPIRVLLADDHRIFLQGLRTVLETEGYIIVGEAVTGREAVELAKQYKPDVAVLDFKMPEMNGIDAAREIHRQTPGTETVLLTMYEAETYAVEALRAGMHGYVLKSQPTAELIQTIADVAHGAMHLSPSISQAAFGQARGKPAHDHTLTTRELQILQMISDGHTTRKIADALSLSAKTVESHRNRMMRKLDTHSIADLIRYAIRHNFVRG